MDALLEETKKDMRQVSVAMADAHRLFHGAGGWNHCELDPCHSVCLFLGDVAAMLMGDKPGASV